MLLFCVSRPSARHLLIPTRVMWDAVFGCLPALSSLGVAVTATPAPPPVLDPASLCSIPGVYK